MFFFNVYLLKDTFNQMNVRGNYPDLLWCIFDGRPGVVQSLDTGGKLDASPTNASTLAPPDNGSIRLANLRDLEVVILVRRGLGY